MTNLRAAAQALGGQIAGRNTVVCPSPGHSPRDRSLSVTFDPNTPDGFLVYAHAGDDWKACRDHVRSRLGLPSWQPGDGPRRPIPARHVAEWDVAAVDAEVNAGPRTWTEDDLLRINRAHALFDEAGDPRGTLAEVYLNKHRRLELPDELAGRVLRFHPRCPWRNEDACSTDHHPALIAAFRSIDDDALTAIHRIALTPSGDKIGRRMLGVVHRAAVKIDASPGHSLAIGEGIETCMAARQLGLGPVWALGSVGAISFFPLIDGVGRLLLLGETGKASEQALRVCGRRWRRAGRRVQVATSTVGSDLNDALLADKGVA
jgi:putative DNA primase/helicase